MDEMNWKDLEQIPVPEGLEQRICARIDAWEAEERARKRSSMHRGRWAAAAACLVIAFGVGLQIKAINARRETEKAITQLAYNLSKGVQKLEEARAVSEKAEHTWEKILNQEK